MSRKVFVAILIILALGAAGAYFKDEVRSMLMGGHIQWVRLGGVQIFVSVADSDETRRQGLSGTPSLSELEGKLFIFDTPGKYGIWMKDMLYPIDIFWINDELKVIHVEPNVAPDTYPQIFTPLQPARYVLETSAGVAESYGVRNGDTISFSRDLLRRHKEALSAQ